MDKNIIVVGNNVHGWISALMTKKSLPDSKVTVIETNSVDVVGMSSSSLPSFVLNMEYLGISMTKIIKETNSTFKNGTKFVNWNDSNDSFYQSFAPLNSLFDQFNIQNTKDAFETYNPVSLFLSQNEDLQDIDMNTALSKENKVPFFFSGATKEQSEKIYNFHNLARYSIHFDSNQMSNFLKKEALNNGIHVVNRPIKSFTQSINGDITSVVLDHDLDLPSDFIIDCSGFLRLIIGKLYNTQWNSYSDYLTVNELIPFSIKNDNKEISPYTEATAMDYGWMWNIPLQDRNGYGYIFDNNKTTKEDAIKEIANITQLEIDTYESVVVESGFYDKVWVNNCVAVGPAFGYIDPIISSDIWTSVNILTKILGNSYFMFNSNKDFTDKVNNYFSNWNSEILDFTYFHYLGKKNNTNFWSQFNDINNAPKTVKDKLNLISISIPTMFDFAIDAPYGYNDYVKLSDALNLLNKELINDLSIKNNFKNKYSLIAEQIDSDIQSWVSGSISNKNIIEYLKNE